MPLSVLVRVRDLRLESGGSGGTFVPSIPSGQMGNPPLWSTWGLGSSVGKEAVWCGKCRETYS